MSHWGPPSAPARGKTLTDGPSAAARLPLRGVSKKTSSSTLIGGKWSISLLRVCSLSLLSLSPSSPLPPPPPFSLYFSLPACSLCAWKWMSFPPSASTSPYSVYLNIWYVSSHKISVITRGEWYVERPLCIMLSDAHRAHSLAQWYTWQAWAGNQQGIDGAEAPDMQKPELATCPTKHHHRQKAGGP